MHFCWKGSTIAPQHKSHKEIQIDALIGILTLMSMPLHKIMNEVTSDMPPRYILARMLLERE